MDLGEYLKIWVEFSEKNPPTLEDSQRDDTAPAQFAAGWYQGASGNHVIDQDYVN